MLLSIVIPVHNASSYLKRCLDSIIHQSYRQIEIILVDDFSTDDSLAMIREYEEKDNRVKVFCNPRNCRAGYTRNKGLREATGAYVWFVDADDWIPQGAISGLVRHLNNSPKDVDLLVMGYTDNFGDAYVKFEKKTRLPRNLGRNEQAMLNFLNLTKGFFSYPFLYLYSQQLLLRHQILFPENVYYEDISFVAMAVHHAKNIEIYSQSSYNYNCEPHNSITRTYSKEKIRDIISAYDRLYEFLASEGLIEKYNDQYLMRFLLHGLGACFQMYYQLDKEDQKDNALKELLQSYLVSDILSDESIIYVSRLIEAIDVNEALTKAYHRLKLDFLCDTKKNWVYSQVSLK
ncbi:glycosyltransferase family 2 protein [Ulvibacterium marinum]|uniref:Glycosyltransferase family 2 protein n=1 Tax=Ulvibacterium marinum TaxID=2419782 RepID=A0A3B0BUC3_9FLAO|nr:glycosyltransferase family 2 protein [Ulvibacterium marinum]RKN76975.1 glycosyltransferase family 2 protein [Ulvibacterium marinum]